MTVLKGDFHVDAVDSGVTIRGALSAGVTVRTGVELLIQGAVLGEVCIGESAVLRLQGSFSGIILSNAGLLMIAGQTDRSALTASSGRVAHARPTLPFPRSHAPPGASDPTPSRLARLRQRHRRPPRRRSRDRGAPVDRAASVAAPDPRPRGPGAHDIAVRAEAS